MGQRAQAGTFALNKIEPIHRWYSYMEGYSACFVEDILDSLQGERIRAVYDPFCGSGTTPLVAAMRGIKPYYSETNPFMRGVTEAKINCARRAAQDPRKMDLLRSFLEAAPQLCNGSSPEPREWDGFEKFFETEQLRTMRLIHGGIEKIEDDDCRSLCMLALSSIAVMSSKMVRRGDLRFARASEKKEQDSRVMENFCAKLAGILEDIESSAKGIAFDAELLSEDARDLDAEDFFDCVITSPPYLNGTNYIRNTKLELKLNGYLQSEADLPAFHEKGIMAGINNVSKRKPERAILPIVQPYIDRLRPAAYDKRIVTMVGGYFSDMDQVIGRLSHGLKDGGLFIMDIGDSQFAGVHIPTHEILSQICAAHGFEKLEEEILRERRSKNGMVLSQRLLKFRLNKRQTPLDTFREKADGFIRAMPYKKEPFCGRSWGHSWHSLCSYQGKLKPAIAHMLVEYFTEPGDVVLDPLCGVGTIPFEACLQGRVGIGNDLSQMAYVVTRAKLERPPYEDALAALQSLEAYIEDNKHSPHIQELKRKYEDFGYNGKTAGYFESGTYSEILCAREFFKDNFSRLTSADCMVFACLLHVLHGNRPYALSRNSHPLTPYAPKGDFVYKNAAAHIRAKIELAYAEKDFGLYVPGQAVWGDYNSLSGLDGTVDAVICSPPFAGSIRFYINNWLRLWMCGWEPSDYKEADTRFLDSRQRKDFSVYRSFFAVCSRVLKPGGRVVLHLGKTKRYDMAAELAPHASEWFETAYIGEENVQELEKHGIKDKGGTIRHQYLFLLKK